MCSWRTLISYLLLSRLFSQSSSYGINIIAVTDYDEILVPCTFSLMRKYFESGESLSGSLMVVSITSATPHIQNRMLEAFHFDPDYSWTIVVRNPGRRDAPKVENPSAVIHEKPQMYFFVVERLDDDDMEDIFTDWKSMENWNPLAQFVVFFSTTEETEEEMTDLMVEILLMFMSRKIFNINVIAQTEESGHVYSKTAFPYEPENNCGSRVIAFQTLDVCDFESNEDDYDSVSKVFVEEYSRGLFLDKIPKDLSGCPLTAYSRSWEPYIFIDDGRMKGIEWMLVQTIAERLHIGIEILIPNKTLFSILQSLIDGEIDIVIGGIDEDPNLQHLVSATIPYLQDDLTWCVTMTKGEQTFNWFNFIRVFKVNTYLMYMLFIGLNTLVICTINKIPWTRARFCSDSLDALITVYGFVFNQPVRTMHLGDSLRICVLMSFVAALLIGNVYNSFLISSLMKPSSLPQIDKAAQLFEYQMSITGSVDIIRHLNKEGDLFRYIRREFLLCYNIEECLQKAASDKHLAVAVSRQYFIHNPRISKDSLYCFDRNENIYTYLVTMLMPNNFHLFHQINPIIQYIIESGHLLKWTRDLEFERMLKARSSLGDNSFKSLNVSQLSGAFLFGGILLMLTCTGLIAEIFVHRMYKRGNRSKIVRILHRLYSK